MPSRKKEAPLSFAIAVGEPENPEPGQILDRMFYPRPPSIGEEIKLSAAGRRGLGAEAEVMVEILNDRRADDGDPVTLGWISQLDKAQYALIWEALSGRPVGKAEDD